MKSFLVSLLVIMTLVVVGSPAFAAPRSPTEIYAAQVFNQYTGYASTARYSAAIKVDAYSRRSISFVGYSTNATDQLANLPGTAIVQWGYSATGPWVTAKDQNGTAISATTSTGFTMIDQFQWIRFGWTKTGTGKRSLSGYLLFGPSN